MAARMRAFDWSRTPLGPMDRWPQTLRTLVDLLLGQPIPMILLWGPDLIQIYNDAYAVIAATKHPAALGQPNRECWPEALPLTEPIYRRVLDHGERVLLEDQLIPLDRHGRGALEDAYFTVSYGPCRDDDGRIGGVFVTVSETTSAVLARRETETRRDAALAVAELGTFEWDVRTDAVRLDARSRDVLGFAPGEGTRADEVFARIDPADRDRVLAEASASREHLSRLESEYRVRRPDGTTRVVRSINDVVPGPDGGAERMVGVFADVTARRQAEAALRESEERFGAAFEQSVVGIVLCDLDGRIRRANAAFCALVGRPPEALVGHTSKAYTHPDDVDRNVDVIGRLKARSEPSSVYPKRYVRPDGTVVHAQVSITAVRDASGTPSGLVAVVEDVTRRTAVERERADLLSKLERQTRLFDAALSAVRDYFFLLDRDGRFAYANKALLDLWGLTAEQAFGRSMTELQYPPEVEAQLGRNVRRVFEAGRAVADETAYTSPTGTTGYYEYILAPVPGPDGEVELVAGTSRDVTARHELAAERERLLATLGNERARLAAIIEQAPAFVCTVRGPDHVFEIVNDRYYEMVGRRGIIGRPVRAALPEVAGQGFFELLDRVYRTGEEYAGSEMPVLLRRGEGERSTGGSSTSSTSRCGSRTGRSAASSSTGWT